MNPCATDAHDVGSLGCFGRKAADVHDACRTTAWAADAQRR